MEVAHAALRGRVAIKSEDGDFSLVVEFVNGGDATVSGHLQPNLYDESVVTYRIDTDQSYLASSLLELRALGE